MRWQRRQNIFIALVAVAVAVLMARLVIGSDSRERYPTEVEWQRGVGAVNCGTGSDLRCTVIDYLVPSAAVVPRRDPGDFRYAKTVKLRDFVEYVGFVKCLNLSLIRRGGGLLCDVGAKK